METKLHISLPALKTLMLNTLSIIIIKKNHIWCGTYYMHIICQQRENTSRVGCRVKCTKVSQKKITFLPMGSFVVYLIPTKWLWDPHVKKLEKNIVGMGMHRIVEQMGKVNSKNWAKIITFEKWLFMTPNWRFYIYPHVAPPYMGANPTLFECHESLSHIHHELLQQTNED
jgi:hypothetical protein